MASWIERDEPEMDREMKVEGKKWMYEMNKNQFYDEMWFYRFIFWMSPS